MENELSKTQRFFVGLQVAFVDYIFGWPGREVIFPSYWNTVTY